MNKPKFGNSAFMQMQYSRVCRLRAMPVWTSSVSALAGASTDVHKSSTAMGPFASCKVSTVEPERPTQDLRKPLTLLQRLSAELEPACNVMLGLAAGRAVVLCFLGKAQPHAGDLQVGSGLHSGQTFSNG
jgi:hypothetical protein